MDKKLGKRIKVLRGFRGYTQEDLANKLKKNISTVKRWERGSGMNLKNFFDVAKVLKVEIGDLDPSKELSLSSN